jgi:hypothetical protein
MACLVGGRLASGLLPPYSIATADQKARSTAAKNWLSSVSLPATVRSGLTHLADAVAVGNRQTAATALSHLVMVAQRSIDEASASELIGVATALDSDA